MISMINEEDYIVASKQKCSDMRMNPYLIPEPPVVFYGDKLIRYQLRFKEFIETATSFARVILEENKGQPILFCISDESGVIIKLLDDNIVFKSLLEKLGVKEGALFSEEINGTNVISLTLQEGRTIELLGTNHYHVPLHGCACYGTVIRNVKDKVIGSISILTAIEMKDPKFRVFLEDVSSKINGTIDC